MPSRSRHYQPRSIQQRPEQLPYRTVTTERRLLPHTVPLSQPKLLLHPLQPIADPTMRVHRSLRPPRRSRGVDHIGQLPPIHHRPSHIFSTLLPDLLPLSVHTHPLPHPRPLSFLLASLLLASFLLSRPHALLGQHNPHARILQHVPLPLLRIPRIYRHIRSARLQHPQQPHHHLHRPLHHHAHQLFALHPLLLQISP